MLPTWIAWTVAGSVAAAAVGVGVGVAVVDDTDDGNQVPVLIDDDTGDGERATVDPTTDTASPTEDGAVDGGGLEVGLPAEVVAAVVFDCPGGSRVGELHSGDRVVATAVDESGGWVAVRHPLDVGRRVWLERAVVVPDESFEALPAETCGVVEPGPVPNETTTVPESTTTTLPESTTTLPGAPTSAPTQPTTPPVTAPPPTPAPTSPPGTPTTAPPPTAPPPTPAPTTPPPSATTTTTTTTTSTTTTLPPDTTGPSLSASRSPAQIFEDNAPGNLCSGEPKTSTITAAASDPSGVASLTASWSFAGGANRNLLASGGSTTFGPFGYNTVQPSGASQAVTITITAVDGAGNQSQTTVSVTVTNADACFI